MLLPLLLMLRLLSEYQPMVPSSFLALMSLFWPTARPGSWRQLWEQAEELGKRLEAALEQQRAQLLASLFVKLAARLDET